MRAGVGISVTGSAGLRASRRELDRHDAPGAGLALHADAPAVRLDDPARDRQAEPRPLARSDPTVMRDLEEAIEDARQLLGGNSLAGIGDGDDHAATAAPNLDRHASVGRRELQ